MGLRDNPQDAIALLRARVAGSEPDVEAEARWRGLGDLVGYRETLFASTTVAAALTVMLANATGVTAEAVLDQLEAMSSRSVQYSSSTVVDPA